MLRPFVHFGARDWVIYVSRAGLRTRLGRVFAPDPFRDPDHPDLSHLARFPVFQEIDASPLERAAIERWAAAGRCLIVPPNRVVFVKAEIYKIALGQP